MDYTKRRAGQAPINIDGAVVERVESLSSLVSTSPTNYHGPNTTVVKRARQRLFPLSRLKRFGMGPQILKKLHHREHPDHLHHLLVWQLLGI